MESIDDELSIHFDVVCLGRRHWRIQIDGVASPVPFTTRDGAAAAARAQARQFHLYRGLPTRVRVIDQDGKFRCTDCYNQLEEESRLFFGGYRPTARSPTCGLAQRDACHGNSAQR